MKLAKVACRARLALAISILILAADGAAAIPTCRLKAVDCQEVYEALIYLDNYQRREFALLGHLSPFDRKMAALMRRQAEERRIVNRAPAPVRKELVRFLLCEAKDHAARLDSTVNNDPACR